MENTAASAGLPGTDRLSLRLTALDALRGTVMIIMALDHVGDFFHRDAALYQPTDLARTTPLLFFKRWITKAAIRSRPRRRVTS